MDDQRRIHNPRHYNQENQNVNFDTNKDLKYQETNLDNSQHCYKILVNSRCTSNLNDVNIDDNKKKSQVFLKNSSNYDGNTEVLFDDFLELSSNDDLNVFKIYCIYINLSFYLHLDAFKKSFKN